MESEQQKVVDQIVGQVKGQVMMLLNSTADLFDAKELTDEQRQVYNDFTAHFGQEVLKIRLEVKND